MKQQDVVVTINVKDLKAAFRRAFPDEQVTDVNGPWTSFWAYVIRKGTVVRPSTPPVSALPPLDIVEDRSLAQQIADGDAPPEKELEDCPVADCANGFIDDHGGLCSTCHGTGKVAPQ